MRKVNVGILIFDMVELLDFAGPFEVSFPSLTNPSPLQAALGSYRTSVLKRLRPSNCLSSLAASARGRFWRKEQHSIGSARPQLKRNESVAYAPVRCFSREPVCSMASEPRRTGARSICYSRSVILSRPAFTSSVRRVSLMTASSLPLESQLESIWPFT